MIPVSAIQWVAIDDQSNPMLQLVKILAPFPDAVEILLELAGLENRFYASQFSNNSSADSNRSRFRPLLESFRGFLVSSLGMDTSKGKPFLSAIWV